METEVLIKDAMTKNVVTVSKDMSICDASKIMEKSNIGSLVVVKGTAPVGIVTERDITYRVVAPDRKPSEVKVVDVMSHPVSTIGPDSTIMKACKAMAKNKLRRLPVIRGGELVGIITNTDIMQIAPGQIDILRELSRMRERSSRREILDRGTCENCGDYGVKLSEVHGTFVCDSCRDDAG